MSARPPIAAHDLVFDAAPLSVGRDFVVYAARLGAERVVVKTRHPHRDPSATDPTLLNEDVTLQALARRKKSAPFVPAALGLTTLGDGRLALVTRFVDGLSLATLIERALVRRRYQGARRWNAATRALVATLGSAVTALHDAGFVHNDLKPENILVRQSASGFAVVLVDLAEAAPIAGRHARAPGGTVAYAAPERLEGGPGTARSDLWALGAILYELLAGTRPYPDDAPADAIAARRFPIDRLPRESAARAWAALPEPVRAALRRALATDPRDRPRSVARFVKSLDIDTTTTQPTMPTLTPTLASTPTATTKLARWRLVLGAVLVLAGSALGVGLGLAATQHASAGAAPLAMCIDAHGVDACRTTLSHPTFARVFGVPVSAWAAALHAVLLLTMGARLLGKKTNLALLMLVIILLAGTTTYLVIGLVVMDVRCTLCLAMHAAALVVGLGGLLVVFDRGERVGLREPRAWAAVLGALAIWVAAAVAVTALTRSAPARAAQAVPAAPLPTSGSAVCPAPLVYDQTDAPTDEASVVIAASSASAPTLVEVLDLTCEACRAAHATLAPFYEDLARTRRAGLRLVLKTDPRGDPAASALVCATRHGGGLAGLDFIAWELRASPGFYTPEDRRRWLQVRVGSDAARCLDAELRAPDGGSLAAHARWHDDIARRAAARPSCDDAATRGAWWCFAGTPSFAVFVPHAPPSTRVDAALQSGLVTASQAARKATLARCLEP